MLERATRATRPSGVSVFTAARILVPEQSSLQVLHLSGPTSNVKKLCGKVGSEWPNFVRYLPVSWVKHAVLSALFEDTVLRLISSIPRSPLVSAS